MQDDAIKAVHEAVKADIEQREREYLVALFEASDEPYPENATRDELRKLYEDEEVCDRIWFAGGLEEDNERHTADDYFEGYSAGARSVISKLVEAGLLQIPEEN